MASDAGTDASRGGGGDRLHPRWVREVVRRYNAAGPDGLGDRRHANLGAALLLDAAGQAALRQALAQPPPDGGLRTGPKVAAWIAARTGRSPMAPVCGREHLRRLGHMRQVPRHARGADAAAQAAF